MSHPWVAILAAVTFVVVVSIFTEQIAAWLAYIIFHALRLGKSVGYLVLIGIPLLIFTAVIVWASHVMHAALLR